MKKGYTVRRWLFAVLALVLVVTMPGAKAKAASASIELTKDLDTVRVGDIIIVTLSISADITPGEFEGYLSYNENILEYVTGPGCIAGGEGILKISDLDPDMSLSVRKYSLYFKAVGIGSCDIAMRGTPEIYEAEMGYLMSVSSGVLSLEVIAAEKASSDARLATLKINPGTLEPAFDREVYEYRITVPYETTSLMVSAKANHLEANVKIEGNSSLDVGQNRVLILVTAEDGTLAKYVIYAVREEKAAITDENNGSESSGTENDGNTAGTTEGATSSGDSISENTEGIYFYVSDEDNGAWLNTGSKYRICEDAENVSVPSGFTKSSIVISGHNVAVYLPEDNPGSDYMLLVLAKEGGAPGLYCFDRVEKTIQRFDETGFYKAAATVSETGEKELLETYKNNVSNLTLVVAIMCGVCMLLIIIIILIATRKHRNDDYDEEEFAPRQRRSSSSSGSYSGGSRSSARSSGNSSGTRRTTTTRRNNNR